MKLLALDTSTEYCSAALWGGRVLEARDVLAGQRHSALLLPMVDDLLAAQGLAPADLDGIAFGAGPGSFTGLRIACSVAQGLALAAGLPVVGIPTLMALAEASSAPRAACCLDARMGEVYFAAYERTADGWQARIAPGLYTAAETPPLPPGEWTACGEGWAAYAEALQARHGGRVAARRTGLWPHARDIAALAAPAFAAGRGLDPAEAAPLYVRDRVALRSDERGARA